MWEDFINWKYCKFQGLGALKDCKVLRGHASARHKVRGREGGREVEGRVMQENILRRLIFMQVQIPAITEILFYAIAISEKRGDPQKGWYFSFSPIEMQVQIPAITELLFCAVAISEVF